MRNGVQIHDQTLPTALDEHRSKVLLASYGVPVVAEHTAEDVKGALTAAAQLGYPVVLKALGHRLTHKSDRGLVQVNLADAAALEQAARTIAAAAGADLEGFLVQPYICARREFMAGLLRDPQFGPVVMVGLGGVYTEALADTSFRLAPLSPNDAAEMLDEIKAKALLGPFRGDQPADRQSLAAVLMGLSRLGIERPDVREVDINPLLITADGRVVAVDALVITGAQTPRPDGHPPVPAAAIGAFFHPRAIAFVGASAQLGKWGNLLVAHTLHGGYKGNVYLVNPKGGTIAGQPVYPSVGDIPGPVDLAVVTIPARQVLPLIAQLAAKKITHMLLITSGFAETGDQGKQLEKNLVDQARAAGIFVLGPNTMGICNPHINLYCTGSPVKPMAGSTAMVAQSGNMGTQLMGFAEKQGIGIRAFCGSGNEGMITIEDYVEAFENDPLTRTVMLYVESVKNGRRFFESARRLGKVKPIVLLKGGQSQAGLRAAVSHTGAMASDSRVFDAMCRQAGIVKVEQPMDLLDLTAAFSSLPLPKGGRAGIMTLGGGWGVVTADQCARFGLSVPELAPELERRFNQILPAYWSHSNPVDIVGETNPEIPLVVMEELMKWDGCDAVIHLGILGRRIFLSRMIAALQAADPAYPKQIIDFAWNRLDAFERAYIERIGTLMETYGKPVFGVRLLADVDDLTVCHMDTCPRNVVFYETPERAVKAFAEMVAYQRFVSRPV
jgi:acyl-CoA synthetase (NDP forming)